MLGVSRQRAVQISHEYEDFPKPEVMLASGRVWSRAAVEAWIQRHPHRPAGPRRRKS
jgi:predicted DNA-binding transcriptional regulator AlpA